MRFAQLDAYGAQVGRSYTLSAFLPADPSKIDAGFEANRIFDYLDYATLQGYDFHGAWESQTNHQSQLYSPPDDPILVEFKGAYVKSNGLGGLMMWSADGDDGSLVNAMFNGLR